MDRRDIDADSANHLAFVRDLGFQSPSRILNVIDDSCITHPIGIVLFAERRHISAAAIPAAWRAENFFVQKANRATAENTPRGMR